MPTCRPRRESAPGSRPVPGPRVRRATAAVACGLLAATALGACQDDGRALAPAPEPTAPVTQAPSEIPDAQSPAEGGAAPFTLSSPGVEPGGLLDIETTCDGANLSPALTISGTPAITAELAVTMVDRDADGFVHWVLAGLSPGTVRIDRGFVPVGSVSAATDSGVQGWDGPCPPVDDGAHEYVFTVHAFAEPVGLAAGLSGRDALAIIEAAQIETAELSVFYARTE